MKRHITCLSRRISHNGYTSFPTTRFLSTQEAIERRHHLFSLEKKRQLESVGRVEKIEVQFKGIPKNCTLVMNKDVSTPYDCAKHLSEWHAETSALALLDGSVYWDMHRPLTENCTLELQNFSVSEPQQVNKAFWRTCSFLLGASVSQAFKQHVPVKLHSFPGPDVRSGSFIYDIELPTLPDWTPSSQELVTLGAELVKLSRSNVPLERLEVGEQLAAEMFADNHHKAGQIPSIAKANGKVTLYRAGRHVDISRGPMVSAAGQLGRAALTAVHLLTGGADSPVRRLHRFQGVALPAGVTLNHFAFSILTERAKKLNPARSPIRSTTEEAPESIAARA